MLARMWQYDRAQLKWNTRESPQRLCTPARRKFATAGRAARYHCRNIMTSRPRCMSMRCSVQAPSMYSFEGAVMVADITGFTKLTELLTRRHAAGIELLTKCINNYFAQIIETVLAHGGHVMRFAGDAIICCFCPTSEEAANADDQGLLVATLRCMQCAAALSSNLGVQHPLPCKLVAP